MVISPVLAPARSRMAVCSHCGPMNDVYGGTRLDPYAFDYVGETLDDSPAIVIRGGAYLFYVYRARVKSYHDVGESATNIHADSEGLSIYGHPTFSLGLFLDGVPHTGSSDTEGPQPMISKPKRIHRTFVPPYIRVSIPQRIP